MSVTLLDFYIVGSELNIHVQPYTENRVHLTFELCLKKVPLLSIILYLNTELTNCEDSLY